MTQSAQAADTKIEWPTRNKECSSVKNNKGCSPGLHTRAPKVDPPASHNTKILRPRGFIWNECSPAAHNHQIIDLRVNMFADR